MENLILNIVQIYVVVGVVSAIIVDISIAITKTSTRLTFIEILATAIAWPAIAGSLVAKALNGDV